MTTRSRREKRPPLTPLATFAPRDGYALTYLAFGAGLDSTALLLAAEKGLHGVPRPDLAIFADTGDEPEYVYEHLWRIAERAERVPGAVPIHVASVYPGFSLVAFLTGRVASHGKTTSQPPLWSLETFDAGEHQGSLLGDAPAPRVKKGQLPRACTRDVKLRVTQRYLRRLMGLRAFRPGGLRVRALLGIARDEAERVNVSREAWCDLVHPFVDAGIRKRDEEALLRAHGWSVPAKSACRACPYHGDDYWRFLKKEHPTDFEAACRDDEALRRFPRMRSLLFVHRSCVPLREVVLGDATDAFGNDCSGTCGA